MEYQSIPLTKFSNISKESFPPPERLDLKQSEMLVDKIAELLKNWNFHLEYPESTPVKEKYRLIYDHWEEFGIPTAGWDFHQDFCTGDCKDCPVKDYCNSYKEWENDSIDLEMSYDPTELDHNLYSDHRSDQESEKTTKSKKEKIKDIMNSINGKDFIAYMHDYCDRWCESCALKSKCSVFYIEKELLKLAANDDPDSSSLESLKHVFSITNDILNQTLKEKNMDIDFPVTKNDSFFPKLHVSEQKVLDAAKEYTMDTAKWLKSLPEEEIFAINELLKPVTVIMHFHVFISTKLARAFFGRVSLPEDDPIQNDSNGSAKIVLTAITRSLESWTHLLDYKKDKEEWILKQCTRLKKLTEMVERSFPHAQEFLRPGFDFL